MKKSNPAVKSMLQLAFYLIALIAIWTVIGLLAFPKESTLEQMTKYVQANEPVLVQVAENAMDGEKNPGIMNSVDVLEMLGKAHISAVEPYKQGAIFRVTGELAPKDGALSILYLPDGQYVLDREGNWSSAAPDKNGTLRFESGASYVAVTRLTDCFFLEESA